MASFRGDGRALVAVAVFTLRRRRDQGGRGDRIRRARHPDPVEVDHRAGLRRGDLREGFVPLRLPRVPVQPSVSKRNRYRV